MPNFSIPLSGLTAESTALSTIANNLSNQNTPATKTRSCCSATCSIRVWEPQDRAIPSRRERERKSAPLLRCSLRAASARPECPRMWPSRATDFSRCRIANGVFGYTRAGDFSVELNN